MNDVTKTPADNDKFAKHSGIRLLSAGKGSARAEVEIKEHHLNGLDIAHGGIIFTLADMAFAAASNSHGIDAVAVNVSISFFKAVQNGRLFAEATEISKNRKLATYRIDVTDEAGEIIASMQGTAYRKTPRKQ